MQMSPGRASFFVRARVQEGEQLEEQQDAKTELLGRSWILWVLLQGRCNGGV